MGLPVHSLQEVGLNYSYRANCGMKSVYISEFEPRCHAREINRSEERRVGKECLL